MLGLRKIDGPRSYYAQSTRWHGSRDFLCIRHSSGTCGSSRQTHRTTPVFRPILHKRWTCGMSLGGLQMQSLQLPTKTIFNVGNHLRYCSIFSSTRGFPIRLSFFPILARIFVSSFPRFTPLQPNQSFTGQRVLLLRTKYASNPSCSGWCIFCESGPRAGLATRFYQ